MDRSRSCRWCRIRGRRRRTPRLGHTRPRHHPPRTTQVWPAVEVGSSRAAWPEPRRARGVDADPDTPYSAPCSRRHRRRHTRERDRTRQDRRRSRWRRSSPASRPANRRCSTCGAPSPDPAAPRATLAHSACARVYGRVRACGRAPLRRRAAGSRRAAHPVGTS